MNGMRVHSLRAWSGLEVRSDDGHAHVNGERGAEVELRAILFRQLDARALAQAPRAERVVAGLGRRAGLRRGMVAEVGQGGINDGIEVVAEALPVLDEAGLVDEEMGGEG